MTGHRAQGTRSGELNGSSIYVARTIKRNERKLIPFMNALARHLGMAADVSAQQSVHVTLLGASGVNRVLLNEHCVTAKDRRAYAGCLEKYVKDVTSFCGEHVARIDPDEPLVAVGRKRNSLALRLIPDQAMLTERAVIEDFLVDRFGGLPAVEKFKPHLTLARMHGAEELKILKTNDPAELQTLLPDGLVAPSKVVLNGLEVYVGKIRG